MNKHDFYFGIYLICTFQTMIFNALGYNHNIDLAMLFPLFAVLTLYHFCMKWYLWFKSSENTNVDNKK